jgi:hypothetical protein
LATAATFEPDGDTAAGDNAAIGYTAAEGLILTGQGSTSDITFKNDADAIVMSIPTGTANVGIGTTAAGSYGKLTVNDTAAKSVYIRSTSTNFSGLLLENTNSSTKWQLGVEGGAYNTAGKLNIGIDGVGSALMIDASRNVGIGTASPGFKVEVVGGTNDGIHIKDAASATVFGGLFTQSAQLALVTRSNHALAFGSNDTTRMTITNAGLVGIGTTAPAVKLDVNGIAGWGGGTTGQTAQIVGANSPLGNGGNLRVLSNTTQATNIGGSLVLGGYYTAQTNSIGFGEIAGRKENATAGNTAGYLAFGTRPNGGNMTERLRIDSVGRVLIGQTASTNNAGKLEVTATGSNAADFTVLDSSYALVCSNNGSAGGLVYFNYNTSNVGTITTNGSNTTYATSSDYRLKEDAQPVEAPINRLKQLKPINFKWKVNGSRCDGFLAHEAQEIVPDAVTGSKDDLDKEGKPIYQGIDQSKLVPLLTAALQEAVAKIEALETRLTALEG